MFCAISGTDFLSGPWTNTLTLYFSMYQIGYAVFTVDALTRLNHAWKEL